MQVHPGRGWRKYVLFGVIFEIDQSPGACQRWKVQLRPVMLLIDCIFTFQEDLSEVVDHSMVAEQQRALESPDSAVIHVWDLLCWGSVSCELYATRKGDDCNVNSFPTG